MRRKKNKISIYMLLGIIYAIMLLTISTAYSFLNEDLSVNATASLVKNEKNYTVEVTETSKSTYNGLTHYQYNVVITYLGNETTTGWEASIQVPYTVQIEGCYNANSCTVNGEVMSVVNADYNGTLSPNNTSASFNLRLAMEDNDYTLNVLDINFKTNNTINPTPNPDPDVPNDPSSNVDYINATYKMKSDWGTRQWYVLTIENTSETETITSWNATFKVTSSDTMTNANFWGGEYTYDESTGLLTFSGPNWAPTLGPSSSVEVNLQITPPAPEPVSFAGITSSGKRIIATIK